MRDAVPAMSGVQRTRDNPFLRSRAGLVGAAFLVFMLGACVLTLPWTFGEATAPGVRGADGAALAAPRYDLQNPAARELPPTWAMPGDASAVPADAHPDDPPVRLNALARGIAMERLSRERSVPVEELAAQGVGPTPAQIRDAAPLLIMGTDVLGRDVFVRVLAGGGISLGIGLAAAFISVLIGTLYGAVSAYAGGRVDAFMMRVVDVLYGLPYILLVVLLAVASDAAFDEYLSRSRARADWIRAEAVQVAVERGLSADAPSVDAMLDAESELLASLETRALAALPPRQISRGSRMFFDVVVLLVAIGGVSWLTMARVIRGQVLSLKEQPFMEAARAAGVPVRRQFARHLLPNLVGPVVVYATLTVPQAILQESFLSFLGIGVRPPLPSWGNLAADGLSELNPYRSQWWLLLFPCLLLGLTLLALNFVGEGLREAFDPRRAKR